MSGRNRLREVHHPYLTDDPRHHHRIPVADSRDRITSSRPQLAVIEERIALQHRDMQSILFDNQRLAATHVALKQELSLAQHDLRNLSTAAVDIKAKRDGEVRDMYEKSLKMEAEVRSIEAVKDELSHVKADAQKLSKAKQELTKELQNIDSDLERARSQLQELPAIKAEIETVHQELQKGRAAVEHEKKTHASNLEHSKAMEKNMVIMAREIDKLRAELVNYEKKMMRAIPNDHGGGYGASSYVVNPGGMYGAANPNPYMMDHPSYAMMMHHHHHQVGGSYPPQYGAAGAIVPNGPSTTTTYGGGMQQRPP